MRKICLCVSLFIYIPVLLIAALSIFVSPAASLIDGKPGSAIAGLLTAVVITPLVATQIFLILHVLEADKAKRGLDADEAGANE